MGKSKEEDKIEKIIRGFLKLPENRRCINCNSLGPQYVCMTFLTYVCTNCSGVHREFTHRVKSVSMAKFSMEEVTALQAGGNERARQIYFKTWDPQRNSIPENSNIHRIRDFIKHVYVDKQYTGETHFVSAQRSRNSGINEPYENKRVVKGENSTFHEKTIDKYNRYAYDESKSPPYSGEFSRYGHSRTGSSHSEGTEGRYQVDDTRISGRAATQMFTTEDIKPRRRSSPDRQQSSDAKKPTLHHVKEILGENSVALRVANHPKFSNRRFDKATSNAQERDHHKESHTNAGHNETTFRRTVSADAQNATSEPPFSHTEPKHKSDSSGSLEVYTNLSSQSDISVIDPQMHISVKPPAKNTAGNAHPNTLEYLLFELFSRAEMTPNDESEILCEEIVVSSPSRNISSSAAATTASNTLSVSMPARSTDANTPKGANSQMVPDLLSDDGVFASEEIGMNQSSSTQHLELTPVSASIQIRHLNEGVNNQPTIFSPTSCAPIPFNNPTAQSPQLAISPIGESESLVEMNSSLADTKTDGRKELPADLFASPYQLSSATASGWPGVSNNGVGFNMHYYPPHMKLPPTQYVARSSNPFDTNDNTAQPHTNMFSSVGYLQGGSNHAFSSMGYLQGGSNQAFIPSGMSHSTNVHHLSPCVSGGSSHSAYMGQQFLHSTPPTSIQGANGFGGEVGSTVLLHSNQQSPYGYPAPTDQRSYPMGGGNPFG